MLSFHREVKFFLLMILLIDTPTVFSQAPVILWQKTIGGTKNDSLVTIVPTKDGGFIVSGHSNSNISGKKTQNSLAGSYDYWIVKLRSNGGVQWNKVIGGNGIDLNPAVIQTSDGGYLIGGKSQSDTGGNKTESAINGSFDYWVAKLDKGGNVQWNNTIGGIQTDVLVALSEASDHSYILAGYSYTIGEKKYDKHSKNLGSSLWCDYWVVKLARSGKKILWEKVYGGSNKDLLTSLEPVPNNGGYILGGYSYSPSSVQKTENFVGNNDYWIVKIDTAGTEIFNKTIGGKFSDYETDAQQTSDSGYILGGYSNSPVSFNKTEPFLGYTDYWVVKLNSKGAVRWNRTLGGSLGDYLSSVQQTVDGGFLIGGTSSSNISATKSENSKGGEDYWIVKLNGSGQLLWDKTIGGSGSDRLSVIREFSSGEFIAGGTSNSSISGDKKNKSIGGNDYWIVRLSTNALPLPKKENKSEINISNEQTSLDEIKNSSFTVTPNPTQGLTTFTYNTIKANKISLTVYDENGKTVLQKSLRTSQGNFTLDLSKYSSGVYYAVLSSGKNFVTRRIVKE